MKQAVTIITLLTLGLSSLGQFEYFSYRDNGFPDQFDEENTEWPTNLILRNGNYEVLGQGRIDGIGYLTRRVVDSTGEFISLDTVRFLHNQMYTQLSESFQFHEESNSYTFTGTDFFDIGGGTSIYRLDDSFDINWHISDQPVADSVHFDMRAHVKLNDNSFLGTEISFYLNSGYDHRELLFLHFDSDGNIIEKYSVPYYNSSPKPAYCLREISGNSVLSSGTRYEEDSSQAYILKYTVGNDMIDWDVQLEEPLGSGGIWLSETNNEDEYLAAFFKITSTHWSGSDYDSPGMFIIDAQGDTTDYSILDEIELLNGGFLDIAQTNDGGYALLCQSQDETDIQFRMSHIIKLNADLELEWHKTYNVEECIACWSHLYDLEIDPIDGSIIAAGMFFNGLSEAEHLNQAWLLKLDACGDEVWTDCQPVSSIDEEPSFEPTLSIYPNPADGVFQVALTGLSPSQQPNSLKVFDTQGRLVYSESLFSQSQLTLDLIHLKAGLFLVTAELPNEKVLATRVLLTGK